MKKNGFIFGCAVALVLLAACATTSDGIKVYKEFEYGENKDSIRITGYTGTSTVVVIPEKIGGKPVKFIGKGAFEGRGLTEITLPQGITTIRGRAFANNKLTSITIPSSVVTIGGNITTGNPLSTPLVIPDNVKTISLGEGYEGFNGQIYGQGESRTITITRSYGISTYTNEGSKVIIPFDIYGIPVTAIEPNAFNNGYVISIDELVLPAGLVRIGSNAFKGWDFKKMSPANDAVAAVWNEYKTAQDQVDAKEQQEKNRKKEEDMAKWESLENAMEQMLRKY